jgi:transposase
LKCKHWSENERDRTCRQGAVVPFTAHLSLSETQSTSQLVAKGRARIEQAVGKLKRFKRIALRCEKTAQNYGSFVALALGFILIKSVHTA